jgi:fucose 4-O-acetylase-like acetyltransferase
MPQKERNVPVDIAKGISIILVVFGHSLLRKRYPEVHDIFSLIRMPLFYFLSGIFFKPFLSPKQFILKKTDQLLKPYFGTLLIVVLVMVFTVRNESLGALSGVLYSTGQTLWNSWVPMWFLTHLWTVFIAAFLVINFTGFHQLNERNKLIIITLLLLSGGINLNFFFTVDWDNIKRGMVTTGLPFSIDLLPVTLSYFLFGHTLSSHVLLFKPNLKLLVIFIILYACILYLSPAFLELNHRMYHSPILASIGSGLGIYLILCLSYFLSLNGRISTVLKTVGYTSLFILIFHGVIKSEVYSFLNVTISREPKLLWQWVAFLSAIGLPILIRSIILRIKLLRLIYFPFPARNDSQD